MGSNPTLSAKLMKVAKSLFINLGVWVNETTRVHKFVWNKFERPQAGPQGKIHGGIL